MEPSIVVETREGTTTTLMRMDAMALANLTDGEVQLQSGRYNDLFTGE